MSKKTRKVSAYQSDSDNDWLDEDIIDDEKPMEVVQIAFGQKPMQTTLGKNKTEKDPSKERENTNEDNFKYIQYLQLTVDNLATLTFKDPNAYLYRLNEKFEAFKTSNSQLVSLLREDLLISEADYRKSLTSRTIVYAIMTKFLTMKMKKRYNVDMTKLSEVLTDSFELKFLTSKQMDFVITLYKTFCNRFTYPQDDNLIQKLQDCYLQSVKSEAMRAELEKEEKTAARKKFPVRRSHNRELVKHSLHL